MYGSRIALYCTSDSEDSKSEVLVGEGSLTNASDNVILVKVDMVPEGLDCEKLLCEGDSLLDLGLAVVSSQTFGCGHCFNGFMCDESRSLRSLNLQTC